MSPSRKNVEGEASSEVEAAAHENIREAFGPVGEVEVSEDSQAVTERIMREVLAKTTVEDILSPVGLIGAEELIGQPLTIFDVKPMKSDYVESGTGFYAILDCKNEAGESIQVGCGGDVVVAQLAALKKINAFPLKAKFVSKTTRAGFTVYRLQTV